MIERNERRWHWVFTGREFRFADEHFPFAIIRYVHDSTENLPMHRHGFIELVFVLDGSANHRIRIPGEGEYIGRISKGDIFIINPDEEHTFLFEEGERLEILNVNFQSSFLDGTFVLGNDEVRVMDFVYQQPNLPLSVRFGNILKLDEEEQGAITGQIAGLARELQEKRVGYRVMIGLVMAQVFALLSRKYVEAQESGKLLAGSKARAMSDIFRVMGFIEHHFVEEIGKAELARIGMCSVRQLSRKFKECTGETVLEYIHRLRIDKARRLLAETDMRITDVCSLVGFNDISFFNKTFRKQMDMTPREYRDRNHKRTRETAG